MRMPATTTALQPATPPELSAVERIVNLNHPALTRREKLALHRALVLRRSYMAQGKGRESNGVARVVLIVWHTCIKTATDDELAEMQPVPLDLVLP